MSDVSRTPTPYVKISLFTDMTAEDANGYVHVPMAIESWPPGMDVRKLLERAAASFDDDSECGACKVPDGFGGCSDPYCPNHEEVTDD